MSLDLFQTCAPHAVGRGGAEPSTPGSGLGDRGLGGQWEGSGWGPAVTRRCREKQLDQSAGVVSCPETLLFYGNTPPAWSERAQPLAGTGKAVLFVTPSSYLLLGKAEGTSDSHLEDPGGGFWVMNHGSFPSPGPLLQQNNTLKKKKAQFPIDK